MRKVIEDIESPGCRTLSGIAVADLKLSKYGKMLLPILITKAKRALAPEPEADEKLLRAHLMTERPVHIRRTLDQSYYWTLKDTSVRDGDQVVFRATSKPDQDHLLPRVVMVDQLWLWILDGSKEVFCDG